MRKLAEEDLVRFDVPAGRFEHEGRNRPRYGDSLAPCGCRLRDYNVEQIPADELYTTLRYLGITMPPGSDEKILRSAIASLIHTGLLFGDIRPTNLAEVVYVTVLGQNALVGENGALYNYRVDPQAPEALVLEQESDPAPCLWLSTGKDPVVIRTSSLEAESPRPLQLAGVRDRKSVV